MRGMGRLGDMTTQVPLSRDMMVWAREEEKPSMDFCTACRSFSSILNITFVLHWLITFLSTLAGLWDITMRPRPNFLPSWATVAMMGFESALPGLSGM